MNEGNRLTQEQVAQVIRKQEHFPGRERDEKEVLGDERLGLSKGLEHSLVRAHRERYSIIQDDPSPRAVRG